MVKPERSWDRFETNQSIRNAQEQIKKDEFQNPIQQQQQPAQELTKEQDKSWGQYPTPSTYEKEPENDESIFSDLTRNLSSYAARLGERFLGRYGDTQKALKEIAQKIPLSTGILGKALHDLMGEEKWEQFVNPKKGAQPLSIPTSEELQNVTEGLTGEYTKPKNKKEAAIQEFFGDVGSTISLKPISLKNISVNNLGIPAASNAVKQTVSHLGFGEDKATYSKLGAWTALSLMANVNARGFAANLMNIGRKGYGQGVNVDLNRYQKNLNNSMRNILQNDPRSELARAQFSGIQQDIQNGQTSIQDLMNRYDSINAAKRSRGMFELNRADRNFAKKSIDQVLNVVRDEINAIGQVNPKALQSWNNGRQAFAVIHQSERMTNWVADTLKGPYGKLATTPVASLFGVSAYGASKVPIVGLTAGTAIPAGYKVSQVAYRIYSDPNLSKYYWDAIRDASMQNGPAFIKNFEKLNRTYEKKEKSVKKSNK